MKFCWANTLFWLIIAVLGTASMLSACGQKGDLYLPDKDKPAQSQKK
jgi:predicted small lipoprotein YifL